MTNKRPDTEEQPRQETNPQNPAGTALGGAERGRRAKDAPQTAPQHYPEKPGAYHGSLEIEVFPAGTKRHLVIRAENPRGNNDPATIIPMLELPQLEEMLRGAQPVQEAPEQGQGTVETLEDQPVGNQQDETDLDQGDGEKPWSALDIEHDGEWYPPGGDWDTYLGWDTASNCWLPQDPDPAPRRRSKRTQTEH